MDLTPLDRQGYYNGFANRALWPIEELTDALIVNPNDKVEVAEAIQHALHMSQEERVARWQAMLKVLWASDVSRWAAAFIKDLAAKKVSRARSKMVLAKRGSDDR
jgi:trehalose 6-phosphate synthase